MPVHRLPHYRNSSAAGFFWGKASLQWAVSAPSLGSPLRLAVMDASAHVVVTCIRPSKRVTRSAEQVRELGRIKKRKQRLAIRVARKAVPASPPIQSVAVYCSGCVEGTLWKHCSVGSEVGDHSRVRGSELLKQIAARKSLGCLQLVVADDDSDAQSVPLYARCDFCFDTMQDAVVGATKFDVVYFSCNDCMVKAKAGPNRMFRHITAIPHLLLRTLIVCPNSLPTCLRNIVRPCLASLKCVNAESPLYVNQGKYLDRKIAAFLEMKKNKSQ